MRVTMTTKGYYVPLCHIHTGVSQIVLLTHGVIWFSGVRSKNRSGKRVIDGRFSRYEEVLEEEREGMR